jgi:hypothetical protein
MTDGKARSKRIQKRVHLAGSDMPTARLSGLLIDRSLLLTSAGVNDSGLEPQPLNVFDLT